MDAAADEARVERVRIVRRVSIAGAELVINFRDGGGHGHGERVAGGQAAAVLAEEWGVDGGEEGAGAQVAEKFCGADREPLSGDVIIFLLPVADSVPAAVLISPAGGFRDEGAFDG